MSLESNDGFALTLKKYKGVPSKPVAVDESKTAHMKLRLQELKDSLYDANRIPKNGQVMNLTCSRSISKHFKN